LSDPGQAGRPSLAEQLDKQTRLRPYFVDGFKPKYAAKATGINIKTVRKYFRIWNKQLSVADEKEFSRRSKIAIGDASLQIDVRLEKLRYHSDRLEEKLNTVGWSISPEYAWAHEKYDSLQAKIAKLELDKCNLVCQPTADVRLQVDVSRITERQNDLGGNVHA
jgi:hypothetical protein